MNEVVITALPHPITTFVLGIMIVFAVITVFFLNRTMSKLEQIEKDNTSTKQDFQSHIKHTEKLISEVSRKVDSRIDKALGAQFKQICACGKWGQVKAKIPLACINATPEEFCRLPQNVHYSQRNA